jgi:uncharacterized RDD family membrane protein YckC
MKCPKCSYLGFETGDRCKNCGYDFSLLAAPSESPDPDLAIQVPDDLPTNTDRLWLDRLHSHTEDVAEAHEMPEPALSSAGPAILEPPPISARETSAYPLFDPRGEEDDEPLIKLPQAPRAPLSVRRTPEQPRLRAPVRTPPAEDVAPSLEFAEEAVTPARYAYGPTFGSAATTIVHPHAVAVSEASSMTRRTVAGLTDHLILLGIDLVVVYSTLRMAGLSIGDWQLLPPMPMLAFLLLLKLSYFGGFTAACGQTIGKMAARIRVVADDGRLDPGLAVRRTLLATASLLTFGAGFIPALLDPDHRALHDRLMRTRVVELPSA